VAGRLAYVPQQPWIINASLRDNVLLGNDFDQHRCRQHIETIYLICGGWKQSRCADYDEKNYEHLEQMFI